MIDNYEKLENGLIRQISISEKTNYGKEYVDTRYNSYGELCNYMSYLRYGYIVSVLNRFPTSILDVGYGNGSFLSVCARNKQTKCFGNDISDYPVPENCERIYDLGGFFDVITFFDSLEHFEDISFVKDLSCNYICISLPECHYFSDEWFENWKHRRPNEHLWHFSYDSLNNFMKECGFECVSKSNVEDTIRKHEHPYSNILTCIFKKVAKDQRPYSPKK